MRVALLTMLEPVGPGGPESTGSVPSLPRAFLQVGGSTVARHQLGLVLALECQRIICLARELTPQLVELQHEAEAAGRSFHVVTAPAQVPGLVTANDELLVLADGLLVAPQSVMGLLESGHGILVQPVESGLPLGFERIDINHGSAGAMRIPGRLAEHLAELPADCDAASSLMRIALQAGVTQRPVPSEAREGVRWRFVRDEAEAHLIESGWIDLHMRSGGGLSAGTFLARLGVRAFGPALLHAGSGGGGPALAATALVAIGTGAGWFGLAGFAFLLFSLCWILRDAATILSRIERDSLGQSSTATPYETLFGALFDVLVIILVVWNAERPPLTSAREAMVAPLALVCLLRMLPGLVRGTIGAWLQDRALLCLLLSIAAFAGVLAPAVQIFAIVLAVLGAVLAGMNARITRA